VRDSTAALFPPFRLSGARSRPRALGAAGREVGVERLLLAGFRLARLVRKVGESGILEALDVLVLGTGRGFPARKALIPPLWSATISPFPGLGSRRLDTAGCRGRLFLDRRTRR